MPLLAYVALCLVVPAAWGVAMYKAFDWLSMRRAAKDRRAPSSAEPEDQPPIDYSI
jgi:hypothetical protein